MRKRFASHFSYRLPGPPPPRSSLSAGNDPAFFGLAELQPEESVEDSDTVGVAAQTTSGSMSNCGGSSGSSAAVSGICSSSGSYAIPGRTKVCDSPLLYDYLNDNGVLNIWPGTKPDFKYSIASFLAFQGLIVDHVQPFQKLGL